MYKRVRAFILNILNSERNIRARIFILLTIIGVAAMLLSVAVDVVFGENLIEIITLILTTVLAPLITYFAIKKDKIQLGAAVLASGVVFVVVPVAFLFGGGLTGGGIIWYCFAYLYIGLILEGKLRAVMIALLSTFVVSMCIFTFYFPNQIENHDRSMWYADSIAAIISVGLAVYFMVRIQYRLLFDENQHAIEQAQKIDELNKAQNRFFSSMSHEIRTPINTIIGLNEMILRDQVSGEVAENARNIQTASKMLLSVINDILDMSKIESGKMEIIKAQYDVGKMLSEIVNIVWVKANEKGLKFSIYVDPSMPSALFSDEVRLKQILINLLNNAIKYTERGSVSLSVHCSKTSDGKAAVTYSVDDTGIGISKENIPYLFDAFRREDEEKNRHIEGTGLGLSIVKQLVDLMGGTISVNSVYSKGSSFIVYLEQEIAEESIIGDFDIGKIRAEGDRFKYHQSFEAPECSVLVVDDNSTNLLVVKKLLKDTRLTIDTADSGMKCLEMTLKKRYDIILMDHLMPQMDGIECLHAIREQAGGLCKDIPVVALTANAGSENQALYRREGFDEYLVKPVDAVELEHTVLTLLPKDKVMQIAEEGESYESDMIVREMKKKIPILITTDSVADIPHELIAKLNIPVISYKVRVNEGVFYDGAEAGSDSVIRTMDGNKVMVNSEAPTVAEYEEFFSEQLTRAQHIIHISSAKRVSKGYVNACEAALTFYNVNVFESGQISSGTGLLVLYAKELAEAGLLDTDQIIHELEKKKNKIRTTCIIDKTEYLYRGGFISGRVSKICEALMFHPALEARNSSIKISRMWVGNFGRVKDKYIKSALGQPSKIDTDTLIITYVGLKRGDAEQICDDVKKIVPFENIYLQKASAAVSIKCGYGTFGLIYARK
ncbi:DegV family protein [Butyrivibrio sp. VCB2006]|uniref:DegV family protein n=1 Tax=Butyrivibrio sp. VCB2006 TaxID=1280679 RepID=UPI000405DA2B|nr:DegV family protein [Butyrivibrio sp. VCB2006]